MTISVMQPIKTSFAGDVEAPMFSPVLGTQKLSAHHGRGGERKYERKHHGHAEGNGKLAKQASDNATHCQNGNKDCDERGTHRKHSKTDLLRSEQCRRHRLHAGLEMPTNVLY